MREWIMFLNSSQHVALMDKVLFGKWEEYKVNTSTVISRFRINNRIPKRIEIDEDEFTDWLHSLGYRRYHEICNQGTDQGI